MKKLTWLVLVLSFVLVAAGCGSKAGNSGSNESSGAGGKEGQNASTNANADNSKKTFKIAISQIVEHASLDATRQGFLDALKDAGIVEGDNLKVDYNNAQDDPNNNLSIAQKIAGDKDNDLVFAIATPSATAVASKVEDTPVLFAAVTDPVDAKLVDNLDKPGANITGAADFNPEATVKLMDFIAANFPNIKSVGVVINTGEANAVVMAKKAEEALAKHDIKLVQAAITNTSEVQQAAESLADRVDAYYVTLDNKVVSGVDAILKVAQDKKKPFFSADRDTVEKGAFATVGFKYYDHGYQAGQMAVEILKDGKKPADMKVSFPDKLDLILNLKAAELYGIEVTDAMKQEVKDPEQNLLQ
ncbi:ABC transporter substrate-binding protein [Paenibacillus sp. GCM10027626]|uniref:ABC transporter substrate-binding protein n=1 Tax=Paenibacillus sp. GCM10027626 TaxID=3273411 RepID=UPI00362CBBD3